MTGLTLGYQAMLTMWWKKREPLLKPKQRQTNISIKYVFFLARTQKNNHPAINLLVVFGTQQ